MHAARGQFHDEEQVERDQAVGGPDFDRREIDRRQHVPMGLEKRLPGGLTLAIRGRLDAVLFQDVAHGGVRDRMPEVGQRALDAVITPGGIFAGQPHHQGCGSRRGRAVVPASS